MLQSINIKNFRCFGDLSIDHLDRVNLVAGKNNTGKTALLEAIYLLLAPNMPEWPTPVNILRGFENLPHSVDLETKWGWLFLNRETRRDVELAAIDNDFGTRTLRVHAEWHPQTTVEFGKPERSGETGPSLVTLTFQGSSGETFKMSASSNGFTRGDARLTAVPIGVVLGSRQRSPEQDSTEFSELFAAGRQSEIVSVLQILEPRLQNLVVLFLGGVPLIYGDIGIGQLVPLAQMGESMNRIMSIVLQMARSSSGVLLIDEIEHGLHHSVLFPVWQAIAEAALRLNVQVFATTHSWECIRAAHEALVEWAGTSYGLRVLRLDRDGGEIRAVVYDEETLTTSVEMNLEVR